MNFSVFVTLVFSTNFDLEDPLRARYRRNDHLIQTDWYRLCSYSFIWITFFKKIIIYIKHIAYSDGLTWDFKKLSPIELATNKSTLRFQRNALIYAILQHDGYHCQCTFLMSLPCTIEWFFVCLIYSYIWNQIVNCRFQLYKNYLFGGLKQNSSPLSYTCETNLN